MGLCIAVNIAIRQIDSFFDNTRRYLVRTTESSSKAHG